MPSTRNMTNRRQQQSGRGRGRGRYNNRRRYNKKQEEPVKKEPVVRCPYIVGTAEWVKWKKMENPIIPFHSSVEVDKKFIPTVPKFNAEGEARDIRIANLQQQMINNKWSLREDEDGNQYFEHPRYTGLKVNVHDHLALDGSIYKIPLISRNDDPEGLGCSIVPTPSIGHYRLESNEFISCWDSRAGRRRQRYLVYLNARIKKREQIEEENKAAAMKN